MPTVAIVSQVWQGHIPAYHRLYGEALRAQGVRVIEILPPGGVATAGTTGATTRNAGLKRALAAFGLAEPLLGFKWWRWVSGEIRKLREQGIVVDAVFFTYLDLHFLARGLPPALVDRLLPLPWAGVVTHPLAVRESGVRFAKGERVLSARQCRAAVVIDESFRPACVLAWPGKAVVVAPDAADVSAPTAHLETVWEIQAAAAGRKIVALLGVLGPKKNVASFVATARLAAEQGLPFFFALVGELSPAAVGNVAFAEISTQLATLPANCRLWNGRLADHGDFNAAVAAADILFLAYTPAPERSNLVAKAAHFRKPVIVRRGHLMALAVERYRLGEIIDSPAADETLAAISRIAAQGSSPVADFEGYAQRNGEAGLRRASAEVIKALGLKGAPGESMP